MQHCPNYLKQSTCRVSHTLRFAQQDVYLVCSMMFQEDTLSRLRSLRVFECPSHNPFLSLAQVWPGAIYSCRPGQQAVHASQLQLVTDCRCVSRCPALEWEPVHDADCSRIASVYADMACADVANRSC